MQRRTAHSSGTYLAEGAALGRSCMSDRKFRRVAGVIVFVAGASACSAEDGAYSGDGLDEPLGQSAEAAITQATTDSFYDMNNVVTIRVTMDAAQWNALKAEEPVGGFCNFDSSPSTDRFQWRPTTQVQVSGTAFPTSTKTYTGAEIKKKSFCGSYSTTKPALKLKFSSAAETDLGTRYLTLNNSIQDPSYIRQALGYRLFRKAGLPASRINFARVYVNGTLVDNGVFVNVEPIRESFIQNPANGFTNKTGGNLYELEHTDDFTSARIPFIDVENLSRFSDKKDLTVAATEIAKSPTNIAQVVDMSHWARMHAMEALLKHWDGFADNRNNTYAYNDVVAVANPSAAAGNVKFKMIPWGLDQILQPGATFDIDDDPTVASIAKSQYSTQIKDRIREYRESVFGRSRIVEHEAFIDLMKTKLASIGASPNAAIEEVRQQLRLVRSGAYYLAGINLTVDNVYVMMAGTMQAMHASNSELVPNSTTDYELFHETYADTRAQRWFLHPGLTGNLFRNEKYPAHQYVHASGSLRTPANNLYMYTTNSNDTVKAKEFHIHYEGVVEPWYDATGYFQLQSVRTGRYVKFDTGVDFSASGRPRVHQTTDGFGTSLYWY